MELEDADAGHTEPTLVGEAIARAATSIRSLAASSVAATEDDDDDSEADEENKGCVEDPGPSNGDVPDALLGGEAQPLTSCGSGGGGTGDEEELERQVAKDTVVVVGGGEQPATADSVLVVGEDDKAGSEKKACPVDGIEIKKKRWQGEDEDGEYDSGDDKPILVENLV
ncbi:unnamed protein product [Musa banksii]